MNKGQCFAGGVLFGVLVKTGLDYTLFPPSLVEKKISVEIEKDVSLKGDPRERFLSQEQAELVYPSLRLHRDAFTQEDIAALNSTFIVSEGKSLPERNLCHYETFSGKELLTDGTCFFLSPQLVLTNYHVASIKDPESFSEFYKLKSLVRSSDGQKFSVETLAISPLYDLALVKTEKAFAVDTVPIGFYQDGLSSLLLSFSEDGEDVERYLPSVDSILEEKRFLLLENGALGSSAVVLPRLYSAGDSGSPVFQEGRLVGLVSYVDIKDMKTFVVPKVREFVSDILREVVE